jgi:mannose-6-phosphate isomerase-like protein (cupin superfamily)
MRITPLLALLALAGAAPAADAQRGASGRATLAVTLTDSSGAPIGNALVIVEGPERRRARTERGRIVFENLPAGTYRLRFEADGFVTLERDVAARGGAPVDVATALTPAPPVPPPPCVDVTPPEPPGGINVVAVDIPGFADENLIGREAAKRSRLACAAAGTATLVQIRDPLADQIHADADEFLYVVAGSGVLSAGGREQALQAGTLALVPRTLPHSIDSRGRGPLILLSVKAGEGCGDPKD